MAEDKDWEKFKTKGKETSIAMIDLLTNAADNFDDRREAFAFCMHVLATIVSGYASVKIKDEHYDKQVLLIDEITKVAKILLKSYKERNNE